MEAILEQAKQLENAIQQLEKRKADLQSEVSQLDQECEKKRSELAEHMQRYAELDRFVPAGDEVISLDVAGQSFKAYRSTLQQVEDSMLATLASGRWEGRSGSRQEDGRVFLDCNPEAFQEILDFLRKRVDRSATAAFRPPAARLADYLGIPVARVIDDIYVAVESQRAGDTKVAPGFMFDVSISGPWHCILQAITFSMGRGGTVSLHVRAGSCLGEAQTAPQGWEKICSSQVAMGRNRLTLPRGGATLIGPGAVLAIYLSFTEGADDLLYSDKPSQTTHKVLSEHRTLSEGMKLLCWRGRVTGVAPFSSGAHMDDRFFVGNIEYSLE